MVNHVADAAEESTLRQQVLALKACIGTIRATLGLTPENIDAAHVERYTREVGEAFRAAKR